MKRGKPIIAPALPKGGATLYERIRELVVAARQTAARGVDLVQVHTNFEIGRHIVEHEQQGETRAGYGKEVVQNLAERLTVEFGQGFSLSNLKLMRQFFAQFRDRGRSDWPDGVWPIQGKNKPDTVWPIAATYRIAKATGGMGRRGRG